MKKVFFLGFALLLLGCSSSIEDIKKQTKDSYDLSGEVTLRSSESEIHTPLLNALVDLYEHLDEVNTQS